MNIANQTKASRHFVKRDEFFDALDQLAEDIEENYRDLPGIKKATFDLDR